MSDSMFGGMMMAALRDALGSRDAHPDIVAPALEGKTDPTARPNPAVPLTARERTLEAAATYQHVENLFIGLTPLGMAAVAFAMLQHLSGDNGEMPDGVTAEMLDPLGELAAFQALVCDQHEGHDHEALSAGEECRRALWHLSLAYDAALKQEG